MATVFEHLDYRQYLADYYTQEKERNPAFSYRYFAMKSGINSPSFLKHVIEGQRNLTRPVIEKFIKALRLPRKEARYFRHCVLFNQARSADEKQEHYAVMRSLSDTVPEAVLNPEKYRYFDNWYTVVIRELVCQYPFGEDYEELARTLRPSITPKQAQEAVTTLLDLGLIRKDKENGYRQTDAILTVDGPIVPPAMRNFTAHTLSLCKEALYTIDRDERHISGMTLGVSEQMYHLLNAEIDAFKDRVKALVTRDRKSDRVYHMNISFIPVTKAVTSEERDRK
jgi:uncharacterized protein (TIGR02147 family)